MVYYLCILILLISIINNDGLMMIHYPPFLALLKSILNLNV